MKQRVSLFFILITTTFFSVLSQNTLQEKLDLAFEFKESGDISGIEFIINDIEPECARNDNDPIKVNFLFLKGHVLYERDKYQETIPILLELIGLYDKHNVINESSISSMDGLADCYYHVGDYSKAAKLYRKVFLLGKDILEQYPDHASEVAVNLASVYQAQNDTAMVEEAYNLAVDYTVKAFKKEKPNDLQSLEEYNQACQSLEKAKNAHGASSEAYVKAMLEKAHSLLSIDAFHRIYMYYCSQAIHIAKNSIGLDNHVMRPHYDEILKYLAFCDSIVELNTILPIALDYWKSINDTALIHIAPMQYLNIAIALNGYGHYEHSLEHSLKNETYLKNHPDIEGAKFLYLMNYIEMLESYIGLGNQDRASYCSKKLCELVDPSNADDCFYLIEKTANALKDAKYELAIELCNIAVKYTEGNRTADFAHIQILNFRGIASMQLNRLNEAEKDFTQAIKMCNTQELKNQWYQHLFNNIGKVYMLRGEYETAINYLKQAVDHQLKAQGSVNKKTQYYLNHCISKL